MKYHAGGAVPCGVASPGATITATAICANKFCYTAAQSLLLLDPAPTTIIVIAYYF